MVYAIDVEAFCQNLRATKPPFDCPFPNCDRVYRSHSGIQSHLQNFDHNNPDSPGQTPRSGSKPNKKKGSNSKQPQNQQRPLSPPDHFPSHTRESLSYAESQRIVEISLEGRTHRLDIFEPLEVISQDEIDNQNNVEKEEKAEKILQKPAKGYENGKSRKENVATPAAQPAKLPEAQVKVLDDYIKPKIAPEQTSSYYRHMQKSVDELDEEVEYDMDEEVRVCKCVWF